MSGFRAFLPNLGQWRQAPEVPLDAAEAHHLTRVLRAREGDKVDVFDGAGLVATGALSLTGRRGAVVVGPQWAEVPVGGCELEIGLAVLKGRNLDEAVRGLAALPVSRIHLLLTERTEARHEARRIESRTAGLARIAVEACKQSGRLRLPEIVPPHGLAPWLASTGAGRARPALVASLESEARPLVRAVDGGRANLLLVGPEGDFSPEEYQMLRAAGCQPVTLGPYVLRADLAVVAAAAIWGAAVEAGV